MEAHHQKQSSQLETGYTQVHVILHSLRDSPTNPTWYIHSLSLEETRGETIHSKPEGEVTQ